MSFAVAPADSTYAFIEKKIRRLTASSSESSLPRALIAQYVNNFYNQDFAYAIKIDQMRSVYTFYTAPYIDKYPVNVNYNQGFRDPVYVDGIQGNFFKDRTAFFNMWPRFPTISTPINGDGSTQSFNFTCSTVPFLRGMVTLGGTDISGIAIQCSDNGEGIMQLDFPNPAISVPLDTAQVSGQPIPGMHNRNTGNPGDLLKENIGTVNYVTGVIAVDFSTVGLIPASGTSMKLFVSQYTTGRPYNVMFWNNELTIRPIPKLVHKIELESYLTPVQFMLSTDNPILNQWANYISYGASMEILRDRQDIEGVANLMEGFKRQEALVLERQAVENIGVRNSTIFSGSIQAQGWNQSWGNWGA